MIIALNFSSSTNKSSICIDWSFDVIILLIWCGELFWYVKLILLVILVGVFILFKFLLFLVEIYLFGISGDTL